MLPLRELPAQLHADLLEWVRGRTWWVRAPLLLYLAYVGVRQALDPQYWSLLGGLNLGIHELGHLVLGAFGKFIAAFGGTLFQLAAPLASMVVFLRQRDYFAIAFCVGWLGTNLMGVGVYMADARTLALPLVTPGGGNAEHDWNYLFRTMGLLSQCEVIGWLTRGLGHLAMLACLAAGGYILVRMGTARGSAERPASRV